MIAELANALDIDEPALHAAIYQATYTAGHRNGQVTISWAKDILYPDSVAIIYGPTAKLEPILAAARERMDATP
jgi:hypothetical protein